MNYQSDLTAATNVTAVTGKLPAGLAWRWGEFVVENGIIRPTLIDLDGWLCFHVAAGRVAVTQTGTSTSGVAIMYSDKFECKNIRVPDAGNVASKLESLWCQFKWGNNRLIVASLYRPPRHTASALEADFVTLEEQYQHVLVNFLDCPIVIAGDLNCDLLSVSCSSKAFLREYLDKYSLTQVITAPTYSSGSLLDVIMTNRNVIRSGTRFCHFSPHYFTRASLSLPRPRFKPRVIECRSFKRFDLLGYETELFATDWSAVYSSPTVTDAWSAFLSAFTPTVKRYAPIKSITLRNPTVPPISELQKRPNCSSCAGPLPCGCMAMALLSTALQIALLVPLSEQKRSSILATGYVSRGDRAFGRAQKI